MVVLEDTRQKPGQHKNIAEYANDHGIAIIRSKLVVGDYQSPPQVSIDTKQGMEEVYQDLVQDHERFRRECILAQSIGTKLIILVENDDGIRDLDDVEGWHNPRIDTYYEKYSFSLAAQRLGKHMKLPSPPVSSKRLARMMLTMSERYGVQWLFCRYDQTGLVIEKVLGGSFETESNLF